LTGRGTKVRDRGRPSGADRRPRIVLVGPGRRFLGGITYYTFCLANALAKECELGVLLIRKLVPQRLFPGAGRVGQALSDLQLPPDVGVYDGLDYYWGASAWGAARFLRRQRPDFLVLQWWSGTVLHSYMLLAWLARLTRTELIIEFHEILDPGEASHPWFARYVRMVAPRLQRRCRAFVVHSEFDRDLVHAQYGIDTSDITIIPHAIYSNFHKGGRVRLAPVGVCNLMFFGLIRPVKGLDDLIDAFNLLEPDEVEGYWLTIVGEAWEGCERILERARSSRYGPRISIVDRYVSDDEVDEFFGGADVAVLPYRQSSQSGVLHVAMGYGLPVVATRVGGLEETVAAYEGGDLVTVASPESLVEGIRRSALRTGTTYQANLTWGDTALRYRDLFASLTGEVRVDDQLAEAS
jgi:glycosyltransferase involved in cell wall biosynthesis